MQRVQNVSKTGDPLPMRDKGHIRGELANSRSFRAMRVKDDLRRYAGDRCLAVKYEPRVYSLRRTQHPESGQSRKVTMGRACCQNAG